MPDDAKVKLQAYITGCYGSLTSFNLLFDELEKRWPIESVRLVHRVGAVKVNEPSLWVEVIAPHRGEAFAACQWLIEEIKKSILSLFLVLILIEVIYLLLRKFPISCSLT
jgi:molybdopterin synthase catalytic subunit